MKVIVALVAALLLVPAGTAAATEIPGTNGAPVPLLNWGPCVGATPEEIEFLRPYQCTTARVPLSYRRPNGPKIELALGRLPAANPAKRIGSLFWNPGGPGAPGKIPPPFSELLHERFDLVGFDPRGVGESTPLRCFETIEESFELLFPPFPITPAQERDVIARARLATDACARNGGPIMSHMATANVARDLDLLRQAVGDRRLSYLGFSYGTHIGAVYANLFPRRVRALMLDSVLDPMEWTTGDPPVERPVPLEIRVGSFLGSYDALLTFLDACEADARCAFRERGRDLLRKYDRLLDRIRREPVDLVDPTTGETFTIAYQDAVYITLGALNDPARSAELAAILQELWLATEERKSLVSLRQARVRRLMASAPLWAARQTEPYFGAEQGYGVLCTDSDFPSNPWEWPFWARLADRRAPYFGAAWTWQSVPCATWPARDADRYAGPWDRETANPVLLVANRLGDPATPYEDAVSTQRLLADARLLTLNSFGHIAFLQSQCVVTAVERYVIALELPRRGTVCQPDRMPFDPLPAPTEGEEALTEAVMP